MAPPVLITDPTDPLANSYCSVEEADKYFSERVPLPVPWATQADKEAKLVMATRSINAALLGARKFYPGPPAYYITSRRWTGAPTSTTQPLAWGRTGMLGANGSAIPPDVFPEELKWATAEWAGQFGMSDPTLNNAALVAGLTSVRAGSVGLTFKDDFIKTVVPDAVWALLLPSWYTDEVVTQAQIEGGADFDVITVNPGLPWSTDRLW